jgi:hypothetical protein
VLGVLTISILTRNESLYNYIIVNTPHGQHTEGGSPAHWGPTPAQMQVTRVNFFGLVDTVDTQLTDLLAIRATLVPSGMLFLPRLGRRVLQKLVGCQNSNRELAFEFSEVIRVEN